VTFLLPLDVPVDPDAPEAKQWLIDELSKPVYQAARPTLFDRIAKAIGDWLDSLQFGSVQGPPALGIGVIVGIVVVGIIVAFLIFGVPRLNRRSAVTGSLFGDDDERTASLIRQAAEAAARSGDYGIAVMEMFRSIARGLAERTVLTVSPGTTARDFASRAAIAFPASEDRLAAAAAAFDDVRYLGRDGTRDQYESISRLESDLRGARPLLETGAR
jgi:hypothetical protein